MRKKSWTSEMNFRSKSFRIFLLLWSLFSVVSSDRNETANISQSDEIGNEIESSEESDVRMGSEEQSEEELEDLEDVNGEEGNFFQGDIELEPDQREAMLSNDTDDNSGSSVRTGLLSDHYRWNKNRRGIVEVPFSLSRNARFCEFHFLTQTLKII